MSVERVKQQQVEQEQCNIITITSALAIFSRPNDFLFCLCVCVWSVSMYTWIVVVVVSVCDTKRAQN